MLKYKSLRNDNLINILWFNELKSINKELIQ